MFRLFSNREINKSQWDQTILGSTRSSVYAISWYLDVVSPGWMGLIDEDHTQVIPVCWRKKYGISYLFQPPYTQFGGLFSNQSGQIDFGPHADLLLNHFKFIEIRLSPGNYIDNQDLIAAKGINQFIDLKPALSEIEKEIHPTHRKNIRRAVKSSIRIKSMEPSEFLNFKIQNQGGYEENLTVLPVLLGVLQQHQAVHCYAALNSSQEIITAVMLVEHANRSILLTSATTEEGKTHKAMFLMIHHCLEVNAGKDQLFDFAGSTLPGIYEFNKGFGASEESIQSIRVNNLPPLLKLLKR
ncbi:MAG: hypothetical protein H8E61_01580 [Bacteroidetes bacterium]|nr:hypothetical protein [Bacteroidota bacterium]